MGLDMAQRGQSYKHELYCRVSIEPVQQAYFPQVDDICVTSLSAGRPVPLHGPGSMCHLLVDHCLLFASVSHASSGKLIITLYIYIL